MRIHALEGTGGFVYSEMGRYQAKPNTPKAELAVGGGTDNEKFAAVDPKTKEPAANGARNVWVTETALGTALNASYMAERISVFGIVVGFALLLSGIGFIVLAFSVLHRKRSADDWRIGHSTPQARRPAATAGWPPALGSIPTCSSWVE